MIAYIFKSLFKNGILLDERKKRPIWLAIIFFVLTLGLVSIPLFTQSGQIHGSSIMTSAVNHELDSGILMYSNDKYDVVINDKGMVSSVDDRLKATLDAEKNTTPIVYKKACATTEDLDKKCTILSLYYYDADPLADRESQKAYTDWLNKKVIKIDDKNVPTIVPHSFMVITTRFFSFNLYPVNNTEKAVAASASFIGLFDQFKGRNMKELTGINNDATYDNWKIFLDDSYTTTKTKTMWTNVILYGALSITIILAGTLILFLVFRGKRSNYKDFTYLDAVKISFTLSFTPAILCMILGLVMGGSSMNGMLFILAYSFRMMWLISKNTVSKSGPQNNKPVYQART